MKYQTGLYGGSFNPLHQGHVDCILQAANQCEELYLVLCVGEKRDEIDYRIRYRWLYRLTEHIGNVKLLMIKDDCDSKSAYTMDDAKEDAQKIKNSIGKPIDAVFFGDDYNEDSFWYVCYPECQHVKIPRNGISSTEIRKAPYKHWDWIPKIVKPYYVKKVLLVGGESTGKSTLTINLAQRFNTNYIDEAGREISLRSGTDELMLQSDYTEILLQQKLNEIKATEESNKVLFIDTDALITRFYLGFLENEQMGKNVDLSDAIDSINSYDLILFLEPDVKFVQDGGRSEEIHRNRKKYSEEIKEIFIKHGKEVCCISGDYQERYLQAVNLVKGLLEP